MSTNGNRKFQFHIFKSAEATYKFGEGGYLAPGQVPQGATGWTEAKRLAHNAEYMKGERLKATLKSRPADVKKSQPPADAVREFDIEGLYRPVGAQVQVEDDSAATTEDAKMGRALESFAGKATDATRRPAWGALDSFLHGDADPNGGAPRPLGYAVVEDPGIASPKEMNYQRRGTDDGLAVPANFVAPKPAGIRMGDGRVLKRSGMFTDVIYGTTNEEAAEAIEKSSGQPEPSLADVLGLSK